MCRFVVNYVSRLSTTERVLCGVVVACLAILITIVLCLTLMMDSNDKDSASDEIILGRIVTREMWLAEHVNQTSLDKKPVHLVIIHHTASNDCNMLAHCAAELRNLQQYFIQKTKLTDIPYNFMVGNDGRCYEGRGWGNVGAHTLNYNKCSLGIGFIGDYRISEVTPEQVKSTQKLLLHGVKHGFLSPDYVIVGGKDLRPKESPGEKLYSIIKNWPHYDGERYKNKTCTDINGV